MQPTLDASESPSSAAISRLRITQLLPETCLLLAVHTSGAQTRQASVPPRFQTKASMVQTSDLWCGRTVARPDVGWPRSILMVWYRRRECGDFSPRAERCAIGSDFCETLGRKRFRLNGRQVAF